MLHGIAATPSCRQRISEGLHSRFRGNDAREERQGLLRSQGLGGVNGRGAASGKVAGERGRRDEPQRHRRVSCRVNGFYPEQERRHEARQRGRGGQSAGHAHAGKS